MTAQMQHQPSAQPARSEPPLVHTSGLGMTLRWLTRQVPTILGAHERHGDLVRVRFAAGRGGLLTRSPDDIKALFTAPPESVPTATANSPIGPFVGESSLLTLNGPQHLRHRRLLLPPFHGDRMRGYADDIAEIAGAELDTWRSGEERRLQPAMQNITLEVILRIVFGVDDAARQDALRRAIVQLLGLTERPALLIPTFLVAIRSGKLVGPVKRYADEVDRLIYREIAARRAAPDLEARTDVLSMLLTARDEDGEPMTDQELRDELVTILFAGHETTASALAWTFERLVRTPAAMTLATRAARGEATDDATPDAVLDAVFQESLRVRPVVPVTARLLRDDFTLSGYHVPKDSLVIISIVGVCQHPDRYDEPAVFRPERFIGERSDTYVWIPFGGGVRRCIGAAFAQLEGRIVLREVLRRATLEVVDPADEVRKRRNVTTVPGNGALVRVRSLQP